MVAMNTIDAAVARMLRGFEDLLIILILPGLTLAFGGVYPVGGNQAVDKCGESQVNGHFIGLFIRVVLIV
jgi:hypothetical protein